MNIDKYIRRKLLKVGVNLKQTFGDDVVVDFEEEQEHLSQTTDKIADITFKLEVVLKR